MSILDEEGYAIGIAVILLGIALGLPNIELGIFGFDFSQFPVTVLTVIRIGIIIIAITIGLKPLENNDNNVF